MFQKVLVLAALLLALQFGFACGGGNEEIAVSTATPISATNTPEAIATTAPFFADYDSFANELELALVSSDGSWFVDNMSETFNCWRYDEWLPECQTAPRESRFPAVQVQRWRGEGEVMGRNVFEDAITGLFDAVDPTAEDEFGSGALTLYAIGEQELPAGLIGMYAMATAILEGPEPGRWVFIWNAARKPQQPGQWELRRFLQVPPEGAGRALAFTPLADTPQEATSYPEGFSDTLETIEEAVADSDSQTLAAMMAFSPYACPGARGITSAPSCFGESAVTTIDAVFWQIYCTACDPHGYTTAGEIGSWLDDLFAGAVGSQADSVGPAEFRVEVVSGAPLGPGFDVTITGISDVGYIDGSPRSPGRWLLTFTVREMGGEWKIDTLTTGEPWVSEWMLPTLLGTNITWTERLPFD